MAPDGPPSHAQNEPFDTGQMVAILRRRLWLIVLCVVVVAAAAFAYSRQQTKEYTAAASLSFSDSSLSQQVAGLAPSSTVNQITQQASNIELVRLGDMAAKTAKQVGHDLTERQVSKSVEVSGQGESSVVAVAATSTSPQLAAAIANAYSTAFVAEQRDANRRFFRSALKLVEKQLHKLPKEQRFGQAAVALQNRKQTLQLLEELHYGNVEVAQVAQPPRFASSPNTKKNTALGAFLGLIIGLGLAFVLERMGRNRQVHDAEDLADTYGLPLLGQIRESAALATAGPNGKPPAPLEPDVAEAFNMLRARIRLRDGAGVGSLLVAAAARGEGATTVARRLAEAAVRLGSRTLLVEADMRDPILAEQLGLQVGTGLPGVLAGGASAEAAVREVGAARADRDADGRALDVLACGISRPANPAALLEGARTAELLEWATSTYDLVVVDAPPITEFADAFPLLEGTDGVLIVGAVGRARRDLAADLRTTLESGPARLLGVVANRVPAGGASGRRGRPGRDAAEQSQAPAPRPAPAVERALQS